MKRLALLLAIVGLALSLAGGQARGDDGFYVIAGGGPSGKVLKTQMFTSTSQNTFLGQSTGIWEQLSTPQWTYTKLSSTSYLVITYQDLLSRQGSADAISCYQLRVNNQYSTAGQYGAMLVCNSTCTGSWSTTGVWSGLPKGNLTLSVWHRQLYCTSCIQNSGWYTTTVLVMEIEK